MQVRRKDMGVLVNRAVLNQVAARRQDFGSLPDALAEKVNLQVERPAVHIVVEIADIGIVALLEIGFGARPLRQDARERGLPASDISGYGDIHVDSFWTRPAKSDRRDG